MGSTCSASFRSRVKTTKDSKSHNRRDATSRTQAWSQNEPSPILPVVFASPAVGTVQSNPHSATPGFGSVAALPEVQRHPDDHSPPTSLTILSSSINVPEHAILRENYAALESEIEGLELLNLKSKAELRKLFNPIAVPATEHCMQDEEMLQLLDEVTVRNRLIRERHILLKRIERRMLRLGQTLQRPVQETCYREVPEDPSLCHICVSRPVKEVYACCQYRGACSQCMKAIQRISPSCPHCRYHNPVAVPL